MRRLTAPKMLLHDRSTTASEDPQEPQDTSFQEVVLALEPEKADIPIGLPMMVREKE